jgi:hypothetical protein
MEIIGVRIASGMARKTQTAKGKARQACVRRVIAVFSKIKIEQAAEQDHLGQLY